MRAKKLLPHEAVKILTCSKEKKGLKNMLKNIKVRCYLGAKNRKLTCLTLFN